MLDSILLSKLLAETSGKFILSDRFLEEKLFKEVSDYIASASSSGYKEQFAVSELATKVFRNNPEARDVIRKSGGFYWLTSNAFVSDRCPDWQGVGWDSPFMKGLASGYLMSYLSVVNGRKDGWIGEDNIYIGRRNLTHRLESSPLQNPYPVNKDMSRDVSIEKFRRHLWDKIKRDDPGVMSILYRIHLELLLEKDTYLSCWCKPLPCHGDVIVSAVRWIVISKSTGKIPKIL